MEYKSARYARAFTLPTVIITSLVMMILLVSALQIISTTRQALEDQFYGDNAVYGIGVRVDGGGQVLRGPDNRMYVASRGSQRIGVINNPDVATRTTAAIGWNRFGLDLGAGNYSMYGLPQMVSLYSPKVWQY